MKCDFIKSRIRVNNRSKYWHKYTITYYSSDLNKILFNLVDLLIISTKWIQILLKDTGPVTKYAVYFKTIFCHISNFKLRQYTYLHTYPTYCTFLLPRTNLFGSLVHKANIFIRRILFREVNNPFEIKPLKWNPGVCNESTTAFKMMRLTWYGT